MRIARFLSGFIVVTCVALLYVHQQLALVKLSYELRKNNKVFCELLDQHKFLAYTIESLKSPQKVEKVLARRNVNLAIPPVWQVVKVSQESSERNLSGFAAPTESRKKLFSFFALKRTAIADTIDSSR